MTTQLWNTHVYEELKRLKLAHVIFAHRKQQL